MYGILGHRKDKVDHVGGTAKVTVQSMTATGHVFHNAEDIIECLIEKYAESSTNYCIKEISEEELQLGWKEVQNYLLLYLSLVNLCSDVPLGCVPYKECKNDYGWNHFDNYTLSVCKISVLYLRNKNAVLEVKVLNFVKRLCSIFCWPAIIIYRPDCCKLQTNK